MMVRETRTDLFCMLWCPLSTCRGRTCDLSFLFFFFQAEDGIRDIGVTGVQTCALPISVMLLWRRLLADRELYVPMDAEALGRYGFMRRLGVFGVEPGARGAAGFLRVAGEVLSEPQRLLWINAPGRFSEARGRPVSIPAGGGSGERRGGEEG